jgi:catechol 2,3-dioxygenase-like lactoylglutathione lyase family enzyme
MIVGMQATKVVVRDVEAAERFYRAVGLKLVHRTTGGEKEVRQKQAWLSVTGDSSSHMLILSQFLEVPTPAQAEYPGNFWLAFNVVDVDAVAAAVREAGGSVLRAGEDRPEHGVRAGVVTDPEGHIIEIVGPMSGAKGVVHDPLARRPQDA